MSSISRTPADEIVGPSSSTDNALARYDGTTGKLLQDSGVALDDNGKMTFPIAGEIDIDDINKLSASNIFRLLVKNIDDTVIVATTYRGSRGAGSADKGFGISQVFELENAGGSIEPAAKVEYLWDDPAGAAGGAEYCRIDFSVMVNGSYETVATMDRNGTSPVVVSGTEPTNPRIGTAWLQQ